MTDIRHITQVVDDLRIKVEIQHQRIKQLEDTPGRIRDLEMSVTRIEGEISAIKEDIGTIRDTSNEVKVMVQANGDAIKRFVYGAGAVVMVITLAGQVLKLAEFAELKQTTTHPTEVSKEIRHGE